MSRRPLTLIFPYYMNRGMLGRQLDHLLALPDEIRDRLHLVIVDDGSPEDGLDSLDGLEPGFWEDARPGFASLQVFRITVDVRWTWIAARNLAVSKSPVRWVLMTDIDHLVPEATLRRVQEKKLDERQAYKFSRVDAPDMTPYKPHPNSWLMTDLLFDKVGGYDERFSGFYGSDGEFRDRVVARSGRPVVQLDEVLIRVPREVVEDASTTTYERKQPEDREGVKAARAKIAADPTPLRGSFPWVQVFPA